MLKSGTSPWSACLRDRWLQSNTNFKNDNVPSILKPFLVSRKFTVERQGEVVALQFGSGKESSSDLVADPQSVSMNVFGKKYVTAQSFDPTRLTENERFI